MKHAPLLLAALLGLSQCKKDDPVSQLPPATQTGANTFGCLVNGQAWTPLGNNSYANYTISYDPTYSYGTLNISTYRYIGKGADDYQTIGFSSDSARTVGVYSIRKGGRHQSGFADRLVKCQYYSGDVGIYCKGKFQITRLDPQAGVISGTFDFIFAKPGCDTIKITNGRFDKKL